MIQGASHEVSASKPATGFMLIRDFVLGNSTLGLVTSADTPAVGGEDPALALPYLSEPPVVYFGSYTTQSTYTFPAATVDAFYAYVTSSSG